MFCWKPTTQKNVCANSLHIMCSMQNISSFVRSLNDIWYHINIHVSWSYWPKIIFYHNYIKMKGKQKTALISFVAAKLPNIPEIGFHKLISSKLKKGFWCKWSSNVSWHRSIIIFYRKELIESLSMYSTDLDLDTTYGVNRIFHRLLPYIILIIKVTQKSKRSCWWFLQMRNEE